MIEVNQDNRKLFYHKENIREWLERGVCRPVTAEIDPSLICNQKCPECTFRNYIRKQYIAYPVLERLVTELEEAGIKGVIISGGGEPLLNPDTYKFIKLLDEKGIKVTLSTNGSLFHRNMKSLLTHCSRIRVSIDAASPEVYQKTHGMSAVHFNKVLENLRRAVRTKKSLGLKVDLGVSFLISRDSVKDVVPAMALYKDIGVDFIQFKPMQIYDEDTGRYHYEDLGSLDEYIDKKGEFGDNDYRISFMREKYYDEGEYRRGYTRCHGASFDLVIGADSKVYICCHLKYNPAYCIGDLESEPLADSIQKIESHSRVTEDCVPMCRLDAINELLEDISHNPDEAISALDDIKPDDSLDKNWL